MYKYKLILYKEVVYIYIKFLYKYKKILHINSNKYIGAFSVVILIKTLKTDLKYTILSWNIKLFIFGGLPVMISVLGVIQNALLFNCNGKLLLWLIG